MSLLASGIPLSLLLDLVLGPYSEDLLAHELPRQRAGQAVIDASSASAS